jgi:hypothetical protein
MHDGERDALVQQIINLAKRSLPFNEGEYEATQYVSSTSAQIGFSFDQEGYKLLEPLHNNRGVAATIVNVRGYVNFYGALLL